jgi:hypothetical protein
MKKLLSFTLLLISGHCFGQAYIPMPTDSAVWRYRIHDIDYLTQVLDNILFLNGQDTIANGITYHKIMARTCKQVGGPGYDPPYVPIDATIPDFYYGAIREQGKQVFLLAGAGEQLIYDFTVSVGDSIPAYTGKNMVTTIDSVLLNGVYHKRYLTTDPTYFVIEGVGTNRGLLPGINDGDLEVNRFICMTYHALTYEPDTTFTCTYIYPAGYVSKVSNIEKQVAEVNIFPVPAGELVNVEIKNNVLCHIMVINLLGATMWQGESSDYVHISVSNWPKGVYYLYLSSQVSGSAYRKFAVE